MDYKWPSIAMKDFDAIVYTPLVSNSPASIYAAISNIAYEFECLVEKSIYKNKPIPIKEGLKDRLKLIIIDEAERLQPKSLEQVRDIYDRQQIAIVLIGMPGIEKRLVRFPQLYSRIGFTHIYKPLSKDEIAFIIENHLKQLDIAVDSKNFSDHEAIATFTRITQGNFRLIDRLLKQTMRVMEVNQLSSITKEAVEAARECLVIGSGY
jgi:DNA transposition AAA+ family ATPase